jgi:transmembrane sensor
MPNPSDRDPIDQQLDALLDRAAAPATPDVEAMWSRLRRETLDVPKPLRPMVALAARDRADRSAARIRGVLLLIGTAAAAVVLLYVVRRHAKPLPPHPIAYRDFDTKRGMRAVINLSDGSRVVLAPQSRLRVPENFGQQTRDLELDGEAIFEVSHDSIHAFRVTAGSARLTDIGTRFDVRAYDSTGAVTVAVATGAVSIVRRLPEGEAISPVTVPRGHVSSLRDSKISAPTVANVEPYFKWETDQLSFDRQSLRDVLASLSRWYDLDIAVSRPALLDRRVTAEFSTQQPTAMLQALAAAVGATVERHGRRVILTSVVR